MDEPKLSLLVELERDWGKLRSQWELLEWRKAAELIDQYAVIADKFIQSLNKTVASQELLINRHKADGEALSSQVTRLSSRQIGRPRKPPRVVVNYYAQFAPMRRPGRPRKTGQDFRHRFISTIDAIKSENQIKTDRDAVAHFLRNLPVRNRYSKINKACKQLSAWRKSVG